MRITERAHILVREAARPGDWVVDATVGNGHDTAFLADCVGPTGRVFGFDIQSAALEAAAERLRPLAQVRLLQAGHEQMAARLPPDAAGRITAVMFNLGYLPGSDKTIVTQPASTLAAIEQALGLLAVGGIITLVLYAGHPGGAEEAAAVRHFTEGLDHIVFETEYVPAAIGKPGPELLSIKRLRN